MGKPKKINTEFLLPSDENIAIVAQALRKGEIAAMPTETVYGLAANVWDPQAVAKIFAAKERPLFDPLIVHVSPKLVTKAIEGPRSDILKSLHRLGLIDLPAIPREVQDAVTFLATHFWPGPLTLVLPKGPKVPDLVTAGLATVAIRMPRNPIAQSLIDAADVPLAAPSANRFGHISPTTAIAVQEELDGRVGWILDGGQCTVGVESTILGFGPDGNFIIHRSGGIPIETLQSIVGERPITISHQNEAFSKPLMPGQLASHYAPTKGLSMIPSFEVAGALDRSVELLEAALSSHLRLGVLLQNRQSLDLLMSRLSPKHQNRIQTWVLSERGSLDEAAQNLFKSLREMDRSPNPTLFAEGLDSPIGLGHAIQDRLTRASKKSDGNPELFAES